MLDEAGISGELERGSEDRELALVEALHPFHAPRVESQRAVDPDLHDVMQFLQANRPGRGSRWGDPCAASRLGSG